jgi:hypothetical protein
MTQQMMTTETGLTAEQMKRRSTVDPTTLSPLARLEALTKEKQARMLRLTLELVRKKLALGLPLSVAENELLAECRRRYYSKEKTTYRVDAHGCVHVTKTVDAEPIMNAMKDYGEIIGVNKRNDKVAGASLIGGIDPVTAANWAKETGLKIGTKEYAQFAKNRIKNDIDYRRFRVGN